MKNIFLALILVSSLSSCIISFYGLTNDYDTLSETQKKEVLALKSFEETESKKIYKINAKQLKSELKKHSKSIVYTFQNGCSSKACKPMFVYENYAKNNGYTLFLVMVGYLHLSETLEQNFDSPLFVVDNEYYNEKHKSKYLRYFENELMEKPLDEKPKEYLGSLYFFEKETLKNVYKELP